MDFGVLFCPNSPDDDRHDPAYPGKQRDSRTEYRNDLFNLREHLCAGHLHSRVENRHLLSKYNRGRAG